MAGGAGRGNPSPCSKFACSLIRVTYTMKTTAASAAARAVGGNDENVVGRNAGDAAGERSVGRIVSNILRRVCRISLVQHDVSVMRTNLLVVIAGNLIVTEVPEV